MISYFFLTKKQWGVVVQLSKGLSNREIGNNLFICEKAVKYHITNLNKRLGTKRREQIVSWFLEVKINNADVAQLVEQLICNQ